MINTSNSRTLSDATVEHQPWCDPATHALTDLGDPDGPGSCVGQIITVGDDRGGWWHQDEPWSTPAFVVDRTLIEEGPDGHLRRLEWEPTADELRVVRTLLPAGDLLELVTRALAEMQR